MIRKFYALSRHLKNDWICLWDQSAKERDSSKEKEHTEYLQIQLIPMTATWH